MKPMPEQKLCGASWSECGLGYPGSAWKIWILIILSRRPKHGLSERDGFNTLRAEGTQLARLPLQDRVWK